MTMLSSRPPTSPHDSRFSHHEILFLSLLFSLSLAACIHRLFVFASDWWGRRGQRGSGGVNDASADGRHARSARADRNYDALLAPSSSSRRRPRSDEEEDEDGKGRGGWRVDDDATPPTPITVYLSLASRPPSHPRIPLLLDRTRRGGGGGGAAVIASSELLRRVHDATSIPLESMRLIYRGRIIATTPGGGGGGGGGGPGEGGGGEEGEDDAVRECGLVDGCVVHVVGRPSSSTTTTSSSSSAVVVPSTATMAANANFSAHDGDDDANMEEEEEEEGEENGEEDEEEEAWGGGSDEDESARGRPLSSMGGKGDDQERLPRQRPREEEYRSSDDDVVRGGGDAPADDAARIPHSATTKNDDHTERPTSEKSATRKDGDDDEDTASSSPPIEIYLSLTSCPSSPCIPLVLDRPRIGAAVITASELRRRVSEVTSIPPESMRLIYRGRIIATVPGGGGGGEGGDEGEDAVRECGLVDGCVVHVVGRPSSSTTTASSYSASAAVVPSTTTAAAANANAPSPSPRHPGLRGYYVWRATVASLYRIHAVPSHEGDLYHKALLPMRPSSERGRVPVRIEVSHMSTRHDAIDVYWVDHKGNEVRKGSIRSGGGTWTQTTYIGHPWTFRVGPGEENVLLRYVPFRIVPSITGAETLNPSTATEGAQRFVLRDVPEGSSDRGVGRERGYCAMRDDDGAVDARGGGPTIVPVCWVDDGVLPEPPLVRRRLDSTSPDDDAVVSSSSGEVHDAVAWSCQQIRREDVVYHGNGIASAKLLSQYLRNIRVSPDEPKYRRMRIGNPNFQRQVYNTGARGVLLALGFVESYGHMELLSENDANNNTTTTALHPDRVRQVEEALAVVDEALRMMEGGVDSALVQPEGGDGYGRAGFGRAGEMST